jgi:unsaturated chondroitin disaccharide hydrolase
MPIRIDNKLTAHTLMPKIRRLFDLSAQKILALEKSWNTARGTPVFTIDGHYTTRGWTEWTQGFQFGSAILQFDATGEKRFLELGRARTIERMASHVSHVGVHDHGFNNVSTYGNLLRLIWEGRLADREYERALYELALKVSGAVQAARWTEIVHGKGYIYSFNGPHSLFVDTMRSLRALAVAHQLGHALMGEGDRRISLLQRLFDHAETTAEFAIYYGEGRDAYDVPGRSAHESIFNINDGSYRCPNSQQGYSPFSTWTRGLAWAICGFTEQLEYLNKLTAAELKAVGRQPSDLKIFLKAATATADFYLANSCADGVPMWDTGAPNLHRLGAYLSCPSDPYNPWEPVDSSAAAIAAQGLLRLGNCLKGKGERYRRAAFTIANTIFDEPYLSIAARHQGLILHSIYHRPNGWDHIARGQKIPNGESSMWGDYHGRELALMILREAEGRPYLTFFRDYSPRRNEGAD